MEHNINKKILLHACCGICSGYPISLLKEMGYSPVVYFYNPNLNTLEEFNRRLEAQKTVCKHFNAELIVEEYNHKEYLTVVKGFEKEPEKGKRCDKCIELRLRKSAQKAQELGIEEYTTSLVISPHKDFEKITAMGENIAKNLYPPARFTPQDLHLKYLPLNFRKQNGFLKTNNISKELNLYRQNYCGCEYSIYN